MKAAMTMRFLLRVFLVLGALGALSTVDAQQLPLRTNWQFNYFQENPAFAGFSDCMELKAGYRQQWAGFDGAPSTAFANLQGLPGHRREHPRIRWPRHG